MSHTVFRISLKDLSGQLMLDQIPPEVKSVDLDNIPAVTICDSSLS